ncbi:MAG: HD domain-containing protein [Roseivirga sp.]
MSNELHAIDIGILVSFLTATLIVGIQAGRKMTSFSTYAVGDKNFSTAVITATVIATWMSGDILFYYLASFYDNGLLYIVVTMGSPLNLLVTGQMLSIRMDKFLHYLSVGEAMGDLYGPVVRIITAVSGIIGRLGIIAIQFQVISKMLALASGFQGPKVMIIAATIVILYSAFGGVRAVTMTDILQFVTFSMFIPLLALTVWNNLPNSGEQVAAVLATEPFDPRKLMVWNSQSMMSLNLLLYLIIPSLGPSMFQRILIARDVYQVRRTFTYASGIEFLIILLVAWLAILLLADSPSLEVSNLLVYVVDRYAHVGLKGLMVVGVIALAMSTADSELNSSSVLAVHDLFKPIFSSFSLSITAARISSVLIGTAGLLLALHESDMLELVMSTTSFYMPVVTVPLLLAIFGFRSSPRAALLGMAAGATTVLTWGKFFAYTGLENIIPGMLANLIVLVGTHYLLGEEARVKVLEKDKRKEGKEEEEETSALALQQQERRERWEKRWEVVRNFDLDDYLAKNLPRKDQNYFLLGLYITAATYMAFYLIDARGFEIPAYEKVYRGVSHATLFVTTALFTFPIWPLTFKTERFSAFFWPLSMWALLFFGGTLLVLLSQCNPILVLVLITSLLMTVLLLHWPLALLLASSGIGAALLFFRQYTGGLPLPDSIGAAQFNIVYLAFIFATLLIVFLRGQEAYALLAEKRSLLGRAYLRLEGLHHEDRAALEAAFVENMMLKRTLREAKTDELGEVVHAGRDIYKKIEAVTKEVEGIEMNQVQPVLEDLKVLNKRLTHTATHLVDLAERSEYVALELGYIKMEDFLQHVEGGIEFSRQERNTTVHNHSQAPQMQCDVVKMGKMLMDSVKFIRLYTQGNAPIQLVLEDTKLRYPLNSVRKKGYMKEIDALRWTITAKEELPPLTASYTAKLTTREAPHSFSFLEKEEVIATNKRLVNAHYGYWEISLHTLVYVIPVELSQVRPKDMDLLAPDLYHQRERADDTYPGAQEQEEALLKAVAEGSKADLALVRDAIEMIKDYHGPAKRRSGEPFYLHPVAVAQIVLDYDQDEATLLGALLHDTVEDTELSLDQVEVRFNKEVRQIVDGVTHLDSAEGGLHRIKLEDNENILQLIGVQDKRILYVKIADRVHNMRTIQFKKYPSQLNKANETIRFFVPLCRELDLTAAASELEDLCMEVFKRGQAPTVS